MTSMTLMTIMTLMKMIIHLNSDTMVGDDTVARTLKVAIRDENCRIRDENCRFLCSNSVILVFTLFTILKSRRELHISRLKRPLKKLQFSSSAFLVYTRNTFLLTREIYLKKFSKKWRTRLECRKRLECPPGRTAGRPT